MVYLATCGPCQNGRHAECEIGSTPPPRHDEPVYGGWICTCRNNTHPAFPTRRVDDEGTEKT